MPDSTHIFKQETRDYILSRFPDTEIQILDVGPGKGAYSKLLRPPYQNIDACEIWSSYIQEFELESKYRKIYVSDICDFEFDYYDLIIIGDVLEHLSIIKAQELLKRILPKCSELIVAVPYELPQEGPANERHVQEDLTPQIMLERYPVLKPLFVSYHSSTFNYGVYVGKSID